MLEPFIHPRSVDARAWSMTCGGCGRCSRSGRRAGARRDRLRREARVGRDPRRRDGGAGAAAAPRRQAAPSCASATRRARCPGWCWRACSAIGRRGRCWTRIGFGGGSSTGCRWRRRPAHRLPGDERHGRAWRGGWGCRRWPPSTPRSAASARRSRRSPARWASRRAAATSTAAAAARPAARPRGAGATLASAGFRDRRGGRRHAGAGRARGCRPSPGGGDRLAGSRPRAGCIFAIWRARLGGAVGAAARRAAAAAHAGDAVRHQRRLSRAPGSRTPRCGSRLLEGLGDAQSRRLAGAWHARLTRGSQPAGGRGAGAARACGVSRPRRCCASACTMWPATCSRWRSRRS